MVERTGGEGRQRHKLLTQEIRAKLPKLNATEDLGMDAQAFVKFFTPDSSWTWYASEFDGEDLFFGLVSGLAVELGYFSLSELEESTGPLGLKVERDMYYKPKTLGELIKLHEKGIESTPLAIDQASRGYLIAALSLISVALAHWDRRVVEISTFPSIADPQVPIGKTIPLIFSFDPEPAGDSEAFFSIANLMIRNEYEMMEQRFSLEGKLHLGFKLNGKVFLPDGKIVEEPENQIVLWPRNEGEHGK